MYINPTKMNEALERQLEAEQRQPKGLRLAEKILTMLYNDKTAAGAIEGAEVANEALSAIRTVQQENERLHQWVNDLQSGMYVNCVYCGHRYGPEKNTPVAMADVLKSHIEQCPMHPMSILKKEMELLSKAFELSCTEVADSCCPHEMGLYECDKCDDCPHFGEIHENTERDIECWRQYYLKEAAQ